MWTLLKKIEHDTDLINSKIDDQTDHMANGMARLETTNGELVEQNKVIMGRLARAESKIERQRAEIIELRARCLRSNVVPKTKTTKSNDAKNENTACIFQNIVSREMRVLGANKPDIFRAHPIGQVPYDKNRMIIAKVTYSGDQKSIFDGAKIMENSGFFISEQIPGEMEERQFHWSSDRKAVSDMHNVGTGSDSSLSLHAGDTAELAGHRFRCWAAPLSSLQDVRAAYDELVKSEVVANADHVAFAYRFRKENGHIKENFDSDSDTGIGLQMLNILRSIGAIDVGIFVSHSVSPHLISMANKLDYLNYTIEGAMIAMSRHLNLQWRECLGGLWNYHWVNPHVPWLT